MVGFRAEFGSSAGETLDVGDGKRPEVLLLCRGWMGMNSVVFFYGVGELWDEHSNWEAVSAVCRWKAGLGFALLNLLIRAP